jgi:transposase
MTEKFKKLSARLRRLSENKRASIELGDERGQEIMAPSVLVQEYDRALYKKRNEIERLFRRLKGFRRIFSRFEKLDVLFLGFLNFALIVEALR